MSQIDASELRLSETADGQDDAGFSRLVPVSESIRYRRRAQSAEKKSESLSQELETARSEVSQLGERLNSLESESKLVRKLAAAGTVDLETAVLLGKSRMEGDAEADIDECVEQLKKEKGYLFGGGVGVSSRRTSGAKTNIEGGQVTLSKAAKKAATTGSRTDLHEYLKLRRNYL